jgi:hypothetical protein
VGSSVSDKASCALEGDSMNTDFIKGVVVPMITPIDKDELIDEAARLIM